uniref:Calmegin n=1 Tax=Gouania willdenowi TaxID=441366 RepID=A0A8C5HPE9_GOUWI
MAEVSDEQFSEADVSDVDDEDVGLDEEELKVLLSEDEMEEMDLDKEETETQPESDVSFQVRIRLRNRLAVSVSISGAHCDLKYPQVTYKTPVPTGDVYFAETFDDGSLNRWQISKTVKEDIDDDIAKYDGRWNVEQLKENKVPGDLGLVLKSRAKHHAIAALLDRPFVFQDEPLIVQYEVNFQDGIDCGGAYVKLLSAVEDLDLEQFHDRTQYSIMFGPDKCGEDYKLHFIFCHKNPLNKDVEEKHAKRADVDLKKFYTDRKTHLYTLVLNPDNSYELLIDQSTVSRGSLLQDVVPPVNPPREIDDPHDSKPEDWDEKAKVPDPEAVKPDDWDEEAPAKIEDPTALKPEGWLDDEAEFISDPTAEKPLDWDEEMDGEWEAPQIPNPACATAPGCGEWKRPMINNPQYKGKWKAPLVDNPNYQGVWKPRKIQNPDFFEDLQPFRMTPFSALGLELWSMTSDIYFDNFLITSHREVADRWASDSWGLKKLVASANEPGIVAQLMIAAEERPWLWVIYVLTVGLPVGLVVLFSPPTIHFYIIAAPQMCDDDDDNDSWFVSKAAEEEEENEEEEDGAADEQEKEEEEDGAGDKKGEEDDDEEEVEDLEGEEEKKSEEKREDEVSENIPRNVGNGRDKDRK